MKGVQQSWDNTAAVVSLEFGGTEDVRDDDASATVAQQWLAFTMAPCLSMRQCPTQSQVSWSCAPQGLHPAPHTPSLEDGSIPCATSGAESRELQSDGTVAHVVRRVP